MGCPSPSRCADRSAAIPWQSSGSLLPPSRDFREALIQTRVMDTEGMAQRRNREYAYVETDGQVYLVRDHGKLRFPRTDETLPFPTEPNGVMDFGSDRIVRRKPLIDHHPEEWL